MHIRTRQAPLAIGCKAILCTLCLGIALAVTAQGAVLSAEKVIRLHKAGAGEELVAHIIENQAIARALVSFSDVVTMKENGVSDAMIMGMIDAGNPTGKQLDRQARRDRNIQRAIQRQEKIIQLQRKRLDVLADYVTSLVTNEHILQLVREEKISGDDYRKIVKYLKQYANDEPTTEWDEGDIDISVTQ